MPIEIKELIIKAEISDQQGSESSSARPGKKEKQKLIQECVEQVLEILNREKER